MTLLRAVKARRDRYGSGHPFDVPAVATLQRLELTSAVTFFVGENGTGKSTVIEDIAVAAGCSSQGGISHRVAPKRGSLGRFVELEWRDPPPIGGAFFLRAETFFETTSAAKAGTGLANAQLLAAFEGHDPHALSHGQSFLQLFAGRFGGEAVFFLDEPEAPLSFRSCLSLLLTMHDLERAGAQFVIATHSPVLTAYPGATILQFDDQGITPVAYEDSDLYVGTREFLNEPARFLRHLLDDG